MESLESFINNFANTEYVELPIARIVVGVGIIIAFLFLRRIVDKAIFARIHKWALRTNFAYDEQLIEAIRKPINALFIIFGFYFALQAIGFENLGDAKTVSLFISQSFKIAMAAISVWTMYRLSEVISFFMTRRFSDDDLIMQKQFIPLISRSIKAFIIAVGGLLIVQNLGYSISSLLAGLGIGGLAVALAAQDTIANFFSSLMIITDMPFRVGDWVKFNDVEGVVEQMGFRTTRVRTFYKSLITVPNKIFMSTPIENFSLRDRRRIYMNLGLTYDTPAEKIEEFIAGIKETIKNHSEIHQDFYLVNFDKFTDFTLNVMVYCFTTTSDWAEFMRIQQELSLSLLRLAKNIGVDYAFPSQSIYWGKGQAPQLPSP